MNGRSLLTSRTAKAVMAPWRLALTAVAVLASVALGAPWWLSVIAGATFFLVTMGLALPRPQRGDRMDAFVLSEPWRRYVSSAQRTRGRYLQTVQSAQPGPLRDRLEEIGRTLEEGLRECWAIARHGDQIDATLARLRSAQLAADLQRMKESQAQSPSETTAATIASLEQQLATADRLRARSTDASDRLRLAQTQLDQLVASAAEVAAGVGDTDALQSGISDLVIELEALRQAVAETNGRPDPGTQATSGA